MSRVLVGGIIVSAVGTATFGSIWLGESFVGNLLSEASGILVSVLVGLTLVEYLTRKQRDSQWRQLKVITLRSIGDRLSGIAFVASVVLPVDPRETRELHLIADSIARNRERLSSVKTVVLRDRKDFDLDLGVAPSTVHAEGVTYAFDQRSYQSEYQRALDTASSRELYLATKDDVGYIRDVLTPRVLQLSDTKLGELLVKLEECERNWVVDIEMIDDWSLPETFAWGRAEEFFRVAGELADELVRAEQ